MNTKAGPSRQGLRLNTLAEAYARKGYVVGTFLVIPSPQMVEILGLAGFDFVVIDREHGSIDLERSEELIRAAAATGIVPMVRVPQCDEVTVRQPLDMGAAGIHVPQIHSAEMARIAVRGARFFPQGERGMQPFVRSASYRAYPTADYLKQANRESAIVLHIEGAEGVASFQEIAAVEGIDVAFIGPYDLSQSLGIPGQVDSPQVKEKMKEVIRAARARNIAVGTWAETPEIALEWRNLGVTYLTINVDSNIVFKACRQIVAAMNPGT